MDICFKSCPIVHQTVVLQAQFGSAATVTEGQSVAGMVYIANLMFL